MSAVYNISPTLLQCFGIIFLGYLAGRLKYITPTQGKGIALFIGNISLPALIFKAMVEVKFSEVNWSFWLSLLLAKAIVFVIVLFMTLLLKKTDRFAAAGIYSIFVSQSNDIAFGLPLLTAVFNDPNTKPMIDYIFLTAPISLAILNPFGFGFLEYQKAKNSQSQDPNKTVHFKHILLLTLKGVVTNPLVFMIIFGIILNFVFHQSMPSLIDGLFTSLSAAFSSTALFYLGWKLGCQQNKLKGLQYALPVVLVIMKSIFLPIIMVLVVRYLVTDVNGNQSKTSKGSILNTTSTGGGYINATTYKTFAFLYGTIPTAPTALVYCSKYNYGEQMVGSGLVIGTLFSAPVIFASIRMLQVNSMANVDMFNQLIGKVSTNASIVSVICCTYTLFVLILLKSYKRRPHFQTIGLILFQLLLGFMGSLFQTYSKHPGAQFHVSIFFLLFALYGCPVWCSMVAIKLCLLSYAKRLSSRVNYVLHFTAISIPFLIAFVASLISRNLVDFANGSSYYFIFNCFKYHFGVTAVYTIVNAMALVSCLVALACLKKTNLLANQQRSMENYTKETIHLSYVRFDGSSSSSDFNPGQSDSHEDSTGSDDYMPSNITNLETIQINQKINSGSDSRHITHHAVLLIIMFFTILLNLIITVWSNVENISKMQGINLELRMLSVVLTYGQGFFSFAIFGFLKEFYTLPFFGWLYTKYLKLRGREKIALMDREDLTVRCKLQCTRFVKHHLHRCSKDIVTNLRFRLRAYEGVFTGEAFVDWLIEESLVDDRSEAEVYGNNLVQGRILEHCLQEHFFYDLPYFYRFTTEALERSVAQKVLL